MMRDFLNGLVGTSAVFSRTVSETDVSGFAQITGDDHPNHTDESYARSVGLGGRVAQGALLVGFIAGASSRYLEQVGRPAVSYGYDNVRFLNLVGIGDRLEIIYEITGVDHAKNNAAATVHITNERGELVAAGTNILHFTSS
ncbi:MaoC-like dehydratase [Pelagibacterium halotolerans B2]|uniref:MaoC-like dehydratase n=2 Tax=Pelagibacterium TaxID=1082930 RepID=G4RC60_PELHB|nr:MaoC-like dehydratase [Pelagibacterium halotolerans B2]